MADSLPLSAQMLRRDAFENLRVEGAVRQQLLVAAAAAGSVPDGEPFEPQ
jgi:hypothetical protein